MKAFLKIVLLVIVALVAVKFLPHLFAFGCVLAAVLLGFITVGVSLLPVLLIGGLVLLAVSSPIWIPVLAIVGFAALVRKSSRKSRLIAA